MRAYEPTLAQQQSLANSASLQALGSSFHVQWEGSEASPHQVKAGQGELRTGDSLGTGPALAGRSSDVAGAVPQGGSAQVGLMQGQPPWQQQQQQARQAEQRTQRTQPPAMSAAERRGSDAYLAAGPAAGAAAARARIELQPLAIPVDAADPSSPPSKGFGSEASLPRSPFAVSQDSNVQPGGELPKAHAGSRTGGSHGGGGGAPPWAVASPSRSAEAAASAASPSRATASSVGTSGDVTSTPLGKPNAVVSATPSSAGSTNAPAASPPSASGATPGSTTAPAAAATIPSAAAAAAAAPAGRGQPLATAEALGLAFGSLLVGRDTLDSEDILSKLGALSTQAGQGGAAQEDKGKEEGRRAGGQEDKGKDGQLSAASPRQTTTQSTAQGSSPRQSSGSRAINREISLSFGSAAKGEGFFQHQRVGR